MLCTIFSHFTGWISENVVTVGLIVSEAAALVSNGKYSGIVKTVWTIVSGLVTKK